MEQNVPSAGEPRRERLPLMVFWFVVLVAGLVVLRSLPNQVNLFEYAYTGRDAETVWQFAAMVAWTALCVGGWVYGRSRGESAAESSSGETALHPWASVMAALPLVGVPLIAVLDAAGVSLGFVEIPIWLGLICWATLRVACANGGSRGDALLPDARGRSASQTAAWVLIGMASAGAAVVWMVSLNALWRGGLVGYWDVGIFANRLANTWTWTYPFCENAAAPPFWDHFNPALYLLTPLVAVFEPIPLLNAVQCVGLASVALVWAAAARPLGAGMMVASGLAWLLHPSVSQMTLGLTYGFHAVTLAMPLFAASLVLARMRRWRWFVACAAAACLFRETVAVGYVGVGLWMLTERELRRAGAVLLVGAAAYFLVVTLAVIPAISGGEMYVGQARFSHLGGTIWEVMLSPLRRPGAVLETMFSRHSVLFVVTFFGLFGFLPLVVGGRRLVMLLPEGVFLLLCDEPRIKSVCFHYQSIVLVQAFWMVLDSAMTGRGVPRVLPAFAARSRSASAKEARAMGAALLVTAVVGAVLLGRWPVSRPTLASDVTPRRPAAMSEVSSWTRGLGCVSATIRSAAHCEYVPDLYVLPNGPVNGEGPALTILDYGDDWVRVEPLRGIRELWALQLAAMARGYVPAHRFGDVVAYGRDVSASAELQCVVEALPTDVVRTAGQEVYPGIEILGWRTVSRRSDDASEAWALELYLRARRAISRRLGWMIEMRPVEDADDVAGVSYYAPAGGMVLPTDEWTAGAIIRDVRGLHVRPGVDWADSEVGLVVYAVDLDSGETFEPQAVVPERGTRNSELGGGVQAARAQWTGRPIADFGLRRAIAGLSATRDPGAAGTSAELGTWSSRVWRAFTRRQAPPPRRRCTGACGR